MKRNNARFNYLIYIYLLGIAFFTLFRIAETVAYCAQSADQLQLWPQYWKVLWIGFRFDSAVSGYILLVPLLMMIIGQMANIGKRWYYAIAHYLTMVLYTVAFFACAADIPYFCYFFARLDAVALTWADDFGTSVSMIFSDPQYVAYIVAFVVVSVVWWLLGRLIYRRVLLANLDGRMSYAWSIPIAAVLAFLLFTAMRGHLTKERPLTIGHAYFCNDPILNQLGLNPAFSFMKSLENAGKDANKPVDLIDLETARRVVQELRDQPADSLIAARLPKGMNVVLVLMESMSTEKTCLSSTGESLTPCLDSLMARSLTFTQAWSAGIHTHNGIYSALSGHPAIFARHIMRNMPTVYGLTQNLKDHGYNTTFFLTHNESFDNMQGFLYHNGFNLVVGESSYPKEEIGGTWGIPDHLLFDHALEHCDSIADKGPFFTCLMTCSDHSPFYFPTDIPLRYSRTETGERMVEYADWSIGRFIRMAQQRPWFDNTLFVFMADHGAALNPVYDMALAYNHVPLLFFAPGFITPQRTERLAQQIDLAPTVLSLLGIPFGDQMLGIDLAHHDRPMAFFSADDKVGVVDGELFYLYRHKQQRASLYRYRTRDTRDLIDSLPERAEEMQRFAFSHIQLSQQMLSDGSTRQTQSERSTLPR